MKLLASLAFVSLTTLIVPLQSKAEWREQNTASANVNLRTSPLGLLVGYYNLDADFPIGSQFTLGPSISYYRRTSEKDVDFDTISTRLFFIGARGSWYPNGSFNSGFYISSLLRHASATVTLTSTGGDYTYEGSAKAMVFTGLAGYHWFLNQFNFNLGAGLEKALSSTTITVKGPLTSYSYEYTSPNWYLALDAMIGVTF